jgi:hypothetical protein
MMKRITKALDLVVLCGFRVTVDERNVSMDAALQLQGPRGC